MKWMLLSLFAIVISPCTQAETIVPDGLGLMVLGDLQESHVERVRSFVEKNTSVAVRLRSYCDALEEEDIEHVANQAEGVRNPSDAALIVLYAGAGVFEPHSLYRYDSGVAVVNVPAIYTETEEQFLRRLEKLSIRAAGLLLDVPLVPNPQSAMWVYRTMEELDFMGRNFDPPSLLRFQENAKERGIPLQEDSPFFMLR